MTRRDTRLVGLALIAAAVSLPIATRADDAAGLLDPTRLEPGRCFHSARLRQVACVNAFSDAGECRVHSLHFFTYAGHGVQALAIDDPGLPPERQDPARVGRPNAFLARNGFEPVPDAAYHPGGAAGPVQVPGAARSVEVRGGFLAFMDAGGRGILMVKLGVRRPDVARIVSVALIPGTRTAAYALMNAPDAPAGTPRPATWTSGVVEVP
ncbi:MAG: hypothetical protein FJ087_12210 [Deltaproteobacteria bacterium]|nr:hypothetical protein [Deltaproteobacteria bacterium]